MCGIAGFADLAGRRSLPRSVIRTMADAIFHRGPDEEGYFEQPGLSLASRRLSIVGLQDGRQPISNEDGSITVVYNGELFDHLSVRSELEAKGHRFRTHCDTEILPHLWEEHQENMFVKLRGQFAVALWDQKQQRLVLARDRFGICPLYWAKTNVEDSTWLVFASEIKSILASRLVVPRPDPRGINHVFTFMAVPGPVTCFAGIEALTPGHYLDIRLDRDRAVIHDRTFWEIDYPDAGHELPANNPKKLVDDFEAVLLRAVEKRLRADVPVVSYLSGGVDSSTVVALACHVRKEPIPTFTIRIQDPQLDEVTEASKVAKHIGADPVVVPFGADEVFHSYPRLIEAAESPVIDTSSAAMMLLAREVHDRGYKVALTGEGADEWLAGYPWFKIHKILSVADMVPGVNLSQWIRRLYLRVTGAPRFPAEFIDRVNRAAGGHNPWMDFYGLISISKLRFFSPSMLETMYEHIPYNDIGPNLERMQKWHPFNQGLYHGGRVHLPGHLLNAKGDRVAMSASVETRYPFLDEDVFDFLAQVPPRLKLKGFTDKYLLRLLAERWLPKEIAWRRKAMFRAPFDSFYLGAAPPFVDQLLSEESLRKTGYFDSEAVTHWRREFLQMKPFSARRTSVEMGLVGVLATQLWHHTFIDASLADLPSWNPQRGPRTIIKGPWSEAPEPVTT